MENTNVDPDVEKVAIRVHALLPRLSKENGIYILSHAEGMADMALRTEKKEVSA